MDEVMTIKEVSKYLKMNERTVSKLASQGLIPATKIASQWRFMRSLLNQWLEQQMVTLPSDQLEVLEEELSPKPIDLREYLSPELVIAHAKGGTRNEILREMVEAGAAAGCIRKPSLFLRALIRRETLCSTAIGDEVAVPHPRTAMSDAYSNPTIIIARSAEGVDFNAIDNQPVKLFFLLCLPGDYLHLKVLARLTRMLKDAHFREALKAAESAEEIYTLVTRKDEQLASGRSN